MKQFQQQPVVAPPQVEIPQKFPEIPQEIVDRFGEAARDWQKKLDEFWTRTNQAIQQAQEQTASQVNSRVVYNVDQFLIYANDVPTPMFALDSTGVKLGDVLVVNTPGRKVYIGEGIYNNANTPFYIDTLGYFSLGDSLVWDPRAETLNISGAVTIDTDTAGSGFIEGARITATVTGSDPSSGALGIVGIAEISGTSSSSIYANAVTGIVRVSDAMDLQNATAVSTFIEMSGAGDITNNVAMFAAQPPSVTSTGNIVCSMQGFQCENIGRSTAIQVIGFNCEDLTGPSVGAFPRVIAFAGEVSSGTQRYNLYMGGSAVNYFAGDIIAVSIGATTPGTGAFTTLSATGTITKNNTAATESRILYGTSSTTGSNYIQFDSTGGSYYTGIENSAGSGFGVAAYDMFMRADNGRGISQYITGTGVVARVSATGLAVTGVVDINGTAASATAGHLQLGSTTQTTIGANGAASALTANPLGYLSAYLGTTHIIIPYYNA